MDNNFANPLDQSNLAENLPSANAATVLNTHLRENFIGSQGHEQIKHHQEKEAQAHAAAVVQQQQEEIRQREDAEKMAYYRDIIARIAELQAQGKLSGTGSQQFATAQEKFTQASNQESGWHKILGHLTSLTSLFQLEHSATTPAEDAPTAQSSGAPGNNIETGTDNGLDQNTNSQNMG